MIISIKSRYILNKQIATFIIYLIEIYCTNVDMKLIYHLIACKCECLSTTLQIFDII